MNLQKVKIGLIIISLFLFIATAVLWVDYQDLSWANNQSNYVVMLSLLLTMIAVFGSIRKK